MVEFKTKDRILRAFLLVTAQWLDISEIEKGDNRLCNIKTRHQTVDILRSRITQSLIYFGCLYF